MSEFSMYKLTQEMNELKAMAYSDEIDDQTFLDTFETMQIAAEEKVEAAGYIVSMLLADAEKCKKEKLHLGDVQKAFESRAEGMKEKIKNLMITAELNELKAGRFTAKVCNAGGSQKLNVDPSACPMEYMRMEFVPDTDKIKAELDKGVKLDFANYEPRKTYLKLS